MSSMSAGQIRVVVIYVYRPERYCWHLYLQATEVLLSSRWVLSVPYGPKTLPSGAAAIISYVRVDSCQGHGEGHLDAGFVVTDLLEPVTKLTHRGQGRQGLGAKLGIRQNQTLTTHWNKRREIQDIATLWNICYIAAYWNIRHGEDRYMTSH